MSKRHRGGGGGGGGGGPVRKEVHPPTAAECATLPAEELLAKALAYHRHEAFRLEILSRTSRAGVPRRAKEAAAVAAVRHRKVLRFLEWPNESFPLETKRTFLSIVHGSDPKRRAFVEETLPTLKEPLRQDHVSALSQRLFRLTTFGLPEEIDFLGVPLLDAETAECHGLLQSWMDGHVAMAVTNFSRLPTEASGSIDVVKIEEVDRPADQEWAARLEQIGMRLVAYAYGYALALGNEILRINTLRRNLHDIDHFSSRLREILASLKFPLMVEIAEERLEAIPGEDLRDKMHRTLPQRMLEIDRYIVEGVSRDVTAVLDREESHRIRFQFPVVMTFEASAVRDGKVAFKDMPSFTLYARAEDLPAVQEWLRKTGLTEKATLRPFLPTPEVFLGPTQEERLLVGLKIQYWKGVFRHQTIEGLVSGLGGGEGEILVGGFPRIGVEKTRSYFRHPSHAVREGRMNLEEGIAANEGPFPPEAVQRGNDLLKGIAAVLRDDQIPIEIRCALRDMFSRIELHLVPLFMEIIDCHRQGAATPEGRRVLGRIMLEGYFCHFPWAEEIVLEYLSKSAAAFGTFNKAPFGIKEIDKEDWKNAHRFVLTATRLAMIPEAVVERFLRVVAAMPADPDLSRTRRRWERLGQLSSYEHREAFEFVARFEGTFYDPRLVKFLASLKPPSPDRARRRFRTTIESETTSSWVREIEKAMFDLQGAVGPLAGDDPAVRRALLDAAFYFAYQLGLSLSTQAEVGVLRHTARILPTWSRLEPDPDEPDPLVTDLCAIASLRLVDIMERLGETLTAEDPLQAALVKFLEREADNPHAVHYLLLGFHLQISGDDRRDWLLQTLRREEVLKQEIDPQGKVVRNTFFREALFEIFRNHFKRNDLSNLEESRILREYAAREDVAQVEVLFEGWARPVPDLRIHPKSGDPFLVEIKTLFYSEPDFEAFRRRFRAQLIKAERQVYLQYRQTREKGNRVIVSLRLPAGVTLPPEQVALLRQDADICAAWSSAVDAVDVRIVS